MSAAALIIDVVGWWLVIGAIVAVPFLTFGIDRVDEDARGAYAFRPLLVPGVMLIWPLVLWRWMCLELRTDRWASRYRPPRAIHLPVAFALSAALVFAVFAGLTVRQSWPSDITPEQLSEAER